MIYTAARTRLVLFLAILLCISVPILAQTDPQTDTTLTPTTSSGKEGIKGKRKDKDKEKKARTKSKKENSDVENIGTRNINKGSINFFSLEKEIQMGRQLAAEVEKQAKLVNDPTINE